MRRSLAVGLVTVWAAVLGGGCGSGTTRQAEKVGGDCTGDPPLVAAAQDNGVAMADAEKTLAIATFPQEHDNWCWAASAQTCMKSQGRDVSQTQQASDSFGDCAADHFDAKKCDRPNWPDFCRYGFKTGKRVDGPLTRQQIKDEIDAGRPFCFTWNWFESGRVTGAHMLVCHGYQIRQGVFTVIAFNPLPVNGPPGTHERRILYEIYCEAPNLPVEPHKHSLDFVNIAR